MIPRDTTSAVFVGKLRRSRRSSGQALLSQRAKTTFTARDTWIEYKTFCFTYVVSP